MSIVSQKYWSFLDNSGRLGTKFHLQWIQLLLEMWQILKKILVLLRKKNTTHDESMQSHTCRKFIDKTHSLQRACLSMQKCQKRKWLRPNGPLQYWAYNNQALTKSSTKNVTLQQRQEISKFTAAKTLRELPEWHKANYCADIQHCEYIYWLRKKGIWMQNNIRMSSTKKSHSRVCEPPKAQGSAERENPSQA